MGPLSQRRPSSKLLTDLFADVSARTRTSAGSSVNSHIHWYATLVHPDNKPTTPRSRQARLARLLYRKPQLSAPHLDLILLDTSASTLNRQHLTHAKGVVLGLVERAYWARRRLGLLGFGNDKVTVYLAPTKARQQMGPVLDGIKGGGGTPLRRGLIEASQLLQRSKRRNPNETQTLYILTDGRSQDDIAQLTISCEVVVIDTEQAAISLGRCRAMALQFGGEYRRLYE